MSSLLKRGTTYMSDVMNSIFSRSKNDIPDGRETVDTEAIDQSSTVEPADGATEAVSEDEMVESSPETASAAESADRDQAEEDLENTADTLDTDTAEADDDEIVEGDEAVSEIPAGDSDEAVADEDSVEAADEDGAIAEEAEPVAVVSDDAPVTVVAEADEDEAGQAEPVAAETRPAPGARGSITMGDGVVVKIVTMVARKVEGVHALGDDGVSVMVDGEIATIEISLVTEFGYRLKTLAEQIRIEVIEAVEEFLGLDVEVVDLHVLDIHLPDAD
jgi:uncharacterized alkaline shock family protein YloU